MSKETVIKFNSDSEELLKFLKRPEDTYHVDIVRQCYEVLSTALSLNQKERIAEIKEAIREYSVQYFDNEPYCIPYHLFRVVKKLPKAFDNGDKDFYAGLLEQSFYRQCAAEIKGEEAYSSEVLEMAEELVKHYFLKGDGDKIRAVLKDCVDCFECSSADKPAMRAAIHLHKIVNLANAVNCKEISDMVSILMEKNGPKIKDEMSPVSESFSIPQEYIDNIVKACSHNDDPGANYFTFGLLFVPTDSVIQRAYEVSNKNSEVARMFTQIRFGTNGNIACITRPDESSEDARRVQSYTLTTTLISPIMHFVVNKGIETGLYNEPDIIDYLAKSPLLTEMRLNILQRGVNAYLENDYISSISIFVPQIEEMIRKTYRSLGCPVTKSDADKTESDTLGHLLKKAPIIIGEHNIGRYLDLILSDNRGWNLRNLFCHGLTEAYNWKNADRLFQILLLLAGLRFVPDDGGQSS